MYGEAVVSNALCNAISAQGWKEVQIRTKQISFARQPVCNVRGGQQHVRTEKSGPRSAGKAD